MPVTSCRADRHARSCSVLHFCMREGILHVQVVDFQGWQSIDAAEVAAGQEASKPREKFVDTQDMVRLGAGV